jgi:hypothetical protein
MRIVYIILAHKLPEQLVRLVRKLNNDLTSFIIHVDKKTDQVTYRSMVDPLCTFKNVFFLHRYERNYRDFNHLKATLDGFQKVYELGIPYDYMILLTGQDYPIKSNEHIQMVLRDSGGNSFLEYFTLPSEHWKNENGGLDRINYWHFNWHGLEYAIREKNRYTPSFLTPLISGPAKFLPFQRKLPPDFKVFGGSAYWCLSRDCIEYVRTFVKQNNDFVKFFKHVLIPEEIFFQTVLLNSPLKSKIINDNLRYIVWPSSHHPPILRKENLNEFINSNKLFARKFDETVDLDVLDMIDEFTP